MRKMPKNEKKPMKNPMINQKKQAVQNESSAFFFYKTMPAFG